MQLDRRFVVAGVSNSRTRATRERWLSALIILAFYLSIGSAKGWAESPAVGAGSFGESRGEFLKEGVPPGIGKTGASGPGCASFSPLVKALSPSVVNITVSSDEDETDDTTNGKSSEERKLPFRSLGSGFVVDADGYIVTNNHVVEGSGKVVVRLLDDRTEFPAEVVGRDVETDLALLKISPRAKLAPAYFGDSDRIEVGDWVIAIGNQFQLGHTVSAGIVSAVARKVRGPSSGPYDQFIQTDASINPGSSGGPLFNERGQVIGINTAIFSPGRGTPSNPGFNIGIGFAIPVNVVKGIIAQLHDRKKVTRGVLGVIIQNIDAELAEALALSDTDGALVADIVPGTPAVSAGFQRRDVIVKFNGHPVKEYDDLPLLVMNTPIGSSASVEIRRAGKSEVLKAVIAERPDRLGAAPSSAEPNRIGVIVTPIDVDTAKALGLPSSDGVLVGSVDPVSPAARAEIRRGDVILEVDGKAISSPSQLGEVINALPIGKTILVLLRKREGTRFTTLKLSGKERASHTESQSSASSSPAE